MSTFYQTSIATNGLVMYYDMSNGKSFKGGPVTNLLPTPSVNGYPTTGNGWGTYNTNQYNGATYFSIGTISSVSGNIVTTAAAHPLRSYDVVNPQTTGGGLTAGTHYLVKKLSATTFSLHTWNSSQDGSQGYINPATGTHKVYDDFANNVRISINSSSFPTQWWGAPHLPNSGLVKEIIPNGFNGLPGIAATDCIRLHFIRPDNVTDGMAYGVDATVTAGVAHTVSFWTRSVTASAVGNYFSYQIYNYGVVSPAGYSFNATLGPVGVWTKQQMTFTPVNPYCISYWFPNTGSMKCDIANIQFEVGSVANTFAPGTRSNTGALLDLTGKNTFTANSLTYASDNTFSFTNASQNYLTFPYTQSDPNNFSVEAWIYHTAHSSDTNIGHIIVMPYGGYNAWIFSLNGTDSKLQLRHHNYNLSSTSYNIFYSSGLSLNRWYHVAATDNGATVTLYVNGVAVTSGSSSASTTNGTMNCTIGSWPTAGTSFDGKIPSVKIYNRSLSSAEISQNFAATKTRYGI